MKLLSRAVLNISAAVMTVGLVAPALAAPPAPTDLTSCRTSDNRVTLDWSDVVDATSYEVWEPSNTPDRPVATVTASTRTSGVLPNDDYTYYVKAVDASGASGFSNAAPINIPNGQLCGSNPPPSTNIDTAFDDAWATRNHETLRSFFEAHVGTFTPGPTVSSPGTVTTQAQADALSGRTVIGNVTFACSSGCTVSNAVFRDVIVAQSGTVTFNNVINDPQRATDAVGFFEVRAAATVNLNRFEIRNSQDGIRSSGTVNARYLYIHSVSPYVETVGNGHQDGFQQYGGSVDCQRCFIDYRNAVTSAILVKPDATTITKTRWNYTFFQGGGYTIHLHDSGTKTVQAAGLDFSNVLVARGYRTGLASIWDINDAARAKADDYVMNVSTVDGGGTRRLVDGVKI
ncbi:hypothetical protein JQX13_38605 [Archangium violaceum]|uniref:fibronectin type III domain-containing protein n=1 Tax=Archangium violaceum TaxID=83451 RepID=UPI00193B76F1|nr:hypothetical protein [Archangium violaceum]QRK05998.1 hypothetical protein JQX13_38605 [Archangium violaceum]